LRQQGWRFFIGELASKLGEHGIFTWDGTYNARRDAKLLNTSRLQFQLTSG
jgi:hypothetical protein